MLEHYIHPLIWAHLFVSIRWIGVRHLWMGNLGEVVIVPVEDGGVPFLGAEIVSACALKSSRRGALGSPSLLGGLDEHAENAEIPLIDDNSLMDGR